MENMIRLIGYGWCDAIPARDLKPGMVTIWNYGYKAEVVSIEFSKTGKTLVATIIENGKTYERKMKSDRLVAVTKASLHMLNKETEAAEDVQEEAQVVTETEQVKEQNESAPAQQDNEKIQAVSIRFDWSESEAIEDGMTVETFAEADEIIRSAARIAPDTGAYDKTAFTITYADGHIYEGRIDIVAADAFKDEPFTQHVRDFVEYSAGIRKPAHMTQEQYDAYMNATEEYKPGARDSWRQFHERYVIGDVLDTPEPIYVSYATLMRDIEQEKHVQDTKVVSLLDRKVEKMFGKHTPEQRLKLYVITQMLGQDAVAEAMATGISVDDLFRLVAYAAYDKSISK